MGKLEDFLTVHDAYYKDFCKFVDGKLAVGIKGEMRAYKFRSDISKIISEFLKANPAEAEKLTRNNDAEKEYLEKLKTANTEVADAALHVKVEQNFDKIYKVFDGLFSMKSPLEILIVKQYEQRLKIRIERYPFPKNVQDLIYEGLFLMSVVHHMAKKDKAAAEAAELASEGKPATAKKDTIEPKKQPMNEVLNSPNFIMTNFIYVGDLGEGMFDFSRERLDSDYKLRAFASCYVDSIDAPTYEELDGGLEGFSQWLDEKTHLIKALPQFRKEVQEDPHEVLITEDNKNERYDPFVQFLLGRNYYNNMLLYPYFFNGSKKKTLSVYGKKFNDIVSYTYPKGVNVFESPSTSSLDKSLKPIYFRDVTDGKKGYKKMSMDKLHSLVGAYISLLGHKDTKQNIIKNIIKYIRITYQCEKDKILVSFTTNNFDLPPQVDSEAVFKNRFKANTGRALYRGMSDAKQFEDMKKRGISSNARHHHDQYYGPGLYWTKDFKQAKDNFAREHGAVIAMAIACEDFPDIIKYAVNNQQYTEMSLMRNNQCLFIRETAMCDARKMPSDLFEQKKKDPTYKNVVFCKTQKDIDDWLNC